MKSIAFSSLIIILFLGGYVNVYGQGSANECTVTTINYDFEQPDVTGIYPTFLNHSSVPGWSTTASDSQIEVWPAPNFENIPAYSGNQFVELNANVVSGLYQDYATPAGTIFNYGFAHRGRLGVDTCQLLAGPPGGPYVNVGPPVTTGTSAWSYNTGSYTVPAGQTTTRFIFQSVNSVGGASIGNFLDNINFTANIGILTEGPIDAFCGEVVSIESIGGGSWVEDPNNPSGTTISDVNSNNITISGFSVPGQYNYEWASVYCNSTITINYNEDFVEVPEVEDVLYCHNSTASPLDIQPINGYTLNWYADSSGTTPLSQEPTVDTSVVGQTIYYVSHENSNGCESDLAPLTITINEVPVATVPTDISVCDDSSNDGIAVFDLTVPGAVALGVQDPTDFSISYYVSQSDADTGTNPITSPDSYQNTSVGFETIYIRIENVDNTVCFDTTSFSITINPYENPAFTMSPTCDGGTATITGDVGGTFTFGSPPGDAAVIDAVTGTIMGGTPSATYTVEYTTSGACQASMTQQVTVYSQPTYTMPTPLEVCDDATPDGLTAIDLSIKNGEIGGNNSQYITYYLTQSDADTDTNVLAIPYNNISNPQTVYVRIEDSTTGCYVTTTLDLEVEQAPAAFVPDPLEYCDPDNDGFGFFDLESLTATITGGDGSLAVSYHETGTEAENNVNAISSPYSNIVSYNQTLWARVESSTIATECATLVEVSLVVYNTPPIEDPSPLELCDNDTDGFVSFDLTVKDSEILDGLDPTEYTLSYYLTQADAEAPSGAIVTPGNYTNGVAGGQTLWVRVEDTNTGCYRITSLDIVVNPLPITFQPSPLELCDDEIADEQTEFDLTVKNNEITGGDGSMIVSYHEAMDDAEAGTSAISPATSYINTSVGGQPANPQTVYVRVEGQETGCYVIRTLTIRVLPNPTPTPSENLPTLELCDADSSGDMVEIFDLTTNEVLLLNGEAGVTPTYHVSMGDAGLGINAIADPTMHESGTSTIYVRVTNDTTGCYTVVYFDLIVHPIPDTVEMTDYGVCEVNTDGLYGFDLESKTSEALGGQDPLDFMVTYHDNQSDADQGIDALINPYTNTLSNPQTIYVRIENTQTGCYVSTMNFNIQVFNGAEANPDGEPLVYVQCDDNMEFDGDASNDSVGFDLSTQDPEVLDGQDPSAFMVSYYINEQDALEGVNPLTIPYINTANPQTIWVRVDNDETPDNVCYAITTLVLEVQPIPSFELEDGYVLCMDVNGTEVIEPAVIDTGLDTSGYSFEWSFNGTVVAGATEGSYMPSQPGQYSVTVMDLTTNCTGLDSTEVLLSSPPTLTTEVVTEAFSTNQVVVATATGGASGIYEYSLDNGPWQEGGTFTNVPPGEHWVVARDIYGCGESGVLVMVVGYPPYFTPNGDGYHDTWNVVGMEEQIEARIYIFDRYGKLLKQLSPSGAGWDGSYNGSQLPTNDYWFTIEYVEPGSTAGQSKKEFKSHFTLKR